MTDSPLHRMDPTSRFSERADAYDADPFTPRYGRAVRKASKDHPAERRLDHAAPFVASSRVTGRRLLVFRHEQRLDAEGLVGRLRSTSYVPQSGEEWDRLDQEIREAWSQFHDADGFATRVYETVVHLGSPWIHCSLIIDH